MAIVILGDPNAPHVVDAGRATLDDLFRDAAGRQPERIALADPPNRSSFTDGAPRLLTYREADRAVGAMAGRLRHLGLPTDAVIALQLPNTVEALLAILGVLRAGMIAVLLPSLWRRADAVAALRRLGAKAIVTTARIGTVDHDALATEIAAELFSIRHVCSFGDQVADGVLRFDELFGADAPAFPPIERSGNPAAHVAVVTFEVTSQGMVAVARSHNELIAGGHAIVGEAGLAQDAAILTPCPPCSLAGLALGLMPWLIGGGMLSLHQPFDLETFAAQCRQDGCDTVVLPGPLVPRLEEAGLLDRNALRHILALWRAPERLTGSRPWRRADIGLTDVLAFGETGLLALGRDADGRPSSIRPVAASRAAADIAPAAEPFLTEAGTLALRGGMVPRHPFPPGIAFTGTPRLVSNGIAAVDTGYACRSEPDGALVLTGPPAGLVSVGAYRFVWRDLKGLIADAAPDASFAMLPDALTGHRLAGQAIDRAAVHTALTARGVHELIADAFREPDQAA